MIWGGGSARGGILIWEVPQQDQDNRGREGARPRGDKWMRAETQKQPFMRDTEEKRGKVVGPVPPS